MQPSQMLKDYEVMKDTQITDEGDIVHFALYADAGGGEIGINVDVGGGEERDVGGGEEKDVGVY